MATITEFTAAVNQICAERGIDPDDVFTALEQAILAAYKRDYGGEENLKVEVDRVSGEMKLIAEKTVVKKVEDKDMEILIDDAHRMEPNLKEGDVVEIEIPVEGFGRIATQTAKQVILQSMKESEKEAVLSEFDEKIGTVVTGLVQRMIGPTAVVEIGKATAQMPPEEQIPNEFYKIGERYKFYLKEIREDQQMIVSRVAPEFLVELFKLEVPEMESGIVEVKAVAREAGSRSKVAVISHQEGVDPIGSCVGQKGMRISNVMSELGEEKIDIIEWSEETKEFVANALGPAHVEKVELPEEGMARVHVSDDQLSLAIGKDGQNVRLAAKLSDLKIDITAPGLDMSKSGGKAAASIELSTRVMNSLEKAGVAVNDVVKMDKKQIAEIKGVGKVAVEEIEAYKASLEAAEKAQKIEKEKKEKEDSEDKKEDKKEDKVDKKVDKKVEEKEEEKKEAGEKESDEATDEKEIDKVAEKKNEPENDSEENPSDEDSDGTDDAKEETKEK